MDPGNLFEVTFRCDAVSQYLSFANDTTNAKQ